MKQSSQGRGEPARPAFLAPTSQSKIPFLPHQPIGNCQRGIKNPVWRTWGEPTVSSSLSIPVGRTLAVRTNACWSILSGILSLARSKSTKGLLWSRFLVRMFFWAIFFWSRDATFGGRKGKGKVGIPGRPYGRQQPFPPIKRPFFSVGGEWDWRKKNLLKGRQLRWMWCSIVISSKNPFILCCAVQCCRSESDAHAANVHYVQWIVPRTHGKKDVGFRTHNALKAVTLLRIEKPVCSLSNRRIWAGLTFFHLVGRLWHFLEFDWFSGQTVFLGLFMYWLWPVGSIDWLIALRSLTSRSIQKSGTLVLCLTCHLWIIFVVILFLMFKVVWMVSLNCFYRSNHGTPPITKTFFSFMSFPSAFTCSALRAQSSLHEATAPVDGTCNFFSSHQSVFIQFVYEGNEKSLFFRSTFFFYKKN